jgi:hypothetical protein
MRAILKHFDAPLHECSPAHRMNPEKSSSK